MSDEKVIMDQEDYHKITDTIYHMLNYYELDTTFSEMEEDIVNVKVLLDKAEPYEMTNNTLNSTIQNIIRLLDHISKYNDQITIERDIVEIKVLLKIEGNE